MIPSVVSLIVGPPGHGVVRHALGLARATGVTVARHRAPPRSLPHPTPDVVHVHFTDQLYGSHVTAAADAFVDLVTRLDGRTVVTLHDVPTSAANDRELRRAAAYRRVAATVDRVVVTAHHERDRLLALGVDRPIDVVPFPISPSRRPTGATRPCAPTQIGVLGFVYPGKGHEVAIEAADPGSHSVVAIGAVSPGHDALLEMLTRRASERRVRFTVTGRVGERVLAQHLATIDVPLAVYDDVSASLSMITWIAAGRRPIVAPSPFVAELAELVPGALEVVDRDDADAVRQAVATACAAPATTRLDHIPEHLSPCAIGACHRSIYRMLGARL